MHTVPIMLRTPHYLWGSFVSYPLGFLDVVVIGLKQVIF